MLTSRVRSSKAAGSVRTPMITYAAPPALTASTEANHIA